MSESDARVTFEPAGKTVAIRRGTRLLEAAVGAGIPLDLPCGGDCLVLLL